MEYLTPNLLFSLGICINNLAVRCIIISFHWFSSNIVKKSFFCSPLLNIEKFIFQKASQNFMEYVSLKMLPKKAILEYTENINL